MQEQDSSGAVRQTEVQRSRRPGEWRGFLKTQALESAMRKRAAGVPTYSVPEAAALLSISQEYLYRLIQADGFPAVRMRAGRGQGRYVVPARAVEQLLDVATAGSACVESADVAEQWRLSVRRASQEA
ncbi:helix-turn-helix domain-containing protein [Pseudonocardia nigra]|uniref:helix-turn-helix domain-containing protein n=1 Tax=Pseudonocardia nigra TaxID=1921578 RepID=UPI001FE425D8|nr:helix-turn-helix domain-containing protein [Pseudonocardia nigra]